MVIKPVTVGELLMLFGAVAHGYGIHQLWGASMCATVLGAELMVFGLVVVVRNA